MCAFLPSGLCAGPPGDVTRPHHPEAGFFCMLRPSDRMYPLTVEGRDYNILSLFKPYTSVIRSARASLMSVCRHGSHLGAEPFAHTFPVSSRFEWEPTTGFGPLRLLTAQGESVSDWSLQGLPEVPGYAAALAKYGAISAISCRNWPSE